MRFRGLPTEAASRRFPPLDSGPRAVRALAKSAAAACLAVGRAAKAVDRAAEWVSVARLVRFFGAGTSGRLAAAEAAELWPTFRLKAEAAVAGGARALQKAVEGAEDSEIAGRRAARGLGKTDVAIGIAASGATPFVRGALAAAKAAGAKTVLVTSNPRPRIRASLIVALPTGPEPLAGSTRMNAATAAKVALNAMTTCAMAKAGRTWRNRMVDVVPSNAKLRDRARRLVAELGGVGLPKADALLRKAGNSRVAIVMARLGCGAAEARRRLAEAVGSLDRLLGR